MKNRAILFLWATLILFSCVDLKAQQTPQTEKQKLVLEFRRLTGADNVNLRIGISLDDVKNDLVGTVENDAELSVAQKLELRKIATDAYDRIDKQLKEFVNDQSRVTAISESAVFQVYDQAFNQSELRELIAFYGSPTGKKALQFLLTLSAQVQKAFQTIYTPQIQEFIKPKITAESDRLKQKIQEAKTKKP